MTHRIKINNGKSERTVYTTGSFKIWGYTFLIHADTDAREIIYCASEKKSGYLALTSEDHDPKLFKVKFKKSLIELWGTEELAKEMLHSRVERSIETHGGVS